MRTQYRDRPQLFHDIGKENEFIIKNSQGSGRILFLDLDGTVRWGKAELGRFAKGSEDVRVFDEVPDILHTYNAAGWRIVAISNQGGVGLGYLTSQACDEAMQETNRQCHDLFDFIFYCTHAPRAGCLCRKPNIGLVTQAIHDLAQMHHEAYSLSNCGFVGDMEDDRKCAENAGIPFMDAAQWRRGGWRKWLNQAIRLWDSDCN